MPGRRLLVRRPSPGRQIPELEPADEHPDGVLVEDAVVVDDLAVLTSPGAASRVGEVESTAKALGAHGLRTARIEPPGHVEGGDVLETGRTAHVGRTTRPGGAACSGTVAVSEFEELEDCVTGLSVRVR